MTNFICTYTFIVISKQNIFNYSRHRGTNNIAIKKYGGTTSQLNEFNLILKVNKTRSIDKWCVIFI